MNIVNTLTLRHIKSHKKRSVLTVMSIIVSVAMVTAVFTSAISFVNYFKDVTLAVDGNWHAYYKNENYSDSYAVFDYSDEIELAGRETEIRIGPGKDDDFTVEACDENYFKLRNISLSEGRMPKNGEELLVFKKYAEKNRFDYKIGDTVTLPPDAPAGMQTRAFRITGFTESEVYETDTNDFFAGLDEKTANEAECVTTVVRFKKLDNSVWEKMGKLGTDSGASAYGNNKELFAYSLIIKNNNVILSLGGFAAVILLIIVIVSVFIIYDSFAISYRERAKYLGMLASVGATKLQKRASIHFEGFIFGLIGIPLGIAAGIGGIAVTFKAIGATLLSTIAVAYDKTPSVSVNWFVVLGAAAVSVLTIFISTYIPARKASKTSAIEAIRQTGEASAGKSRRGKTKKLRSSKLANVLLGYEGVLAVKNFKRNRKRSRTIVFSLALSVVVFISVTNFSFMLGELMNMNYSASADIYVSVPHKDAEGLKKIIAQNENIEESTVYSVYECEVSEILFAEKTRSLFGEHKMLAVFLDDTSFDDYLTQLGEKPEKYHNAASPLAIVHNSAVTTDSGKKVKIKPLADLSGTRLGGEIIFGEKDESGEKRTPFSAAVGIQTDEDWNRTYFNYQYLSYPLFILPAEAEQGFFETENRTDDFEAYINISCDDEDKVEEQLKADAAAEGITLSIFNSNSQMKSLNSFLTIGKVFIYGFITLITLISALNIINTISTSMNERRREFAMVRSVGMTPASFKKMIYYESFRYGVAALIGAFPVSFAVHYGMYFILKKTYDLGFSVNPLIFTSAGVAVFAVIGAALLLSVGRIKNDNIIETLKEDID